MRDTAKRKPSSLLIKVLNVLTVLVLLAAIFSITKLVTELRRSFNREPYSNMEYNLQDENYNRGYDVDPFQSVHEEEYRVAEYADAAFRHLFYESAGNEEQAERMKERMQSAREGTGKLSVSVDDVDAVLDSITVYPNKSAS